MLSTVLQESPTAKRMRFKNKMQMAIPPLRLRQHQSVLKDIKENLGEAFISGVLGTQDVLENHPPFQFLCLNLVVTSLTCFAII